MEFLRSDFNQEFVHEVADRYRDMMACAQVLSKRFETVPSSGITPDYIEGPIDRSRLMTDKEADEILKSLSTASGSGGDLGGDSSRGKGTASAKPRSMMMGQQLTEEQKKVCLSYVFILSCGA